MTTFILIAGSLLAGLIFNFSKSLPKGSYKSINAWVLYIAMPALSLKYIPAITWSKEMLFPAIAPVIVWVGGWLSIQLYSRFNNISNATRGCLKLALGLSNTSFLGFPLIIAYYSEKELSIAIVYDQVNFILLSTVGIISAIRASEKEELSGGVLLKKVIKFPPFIAFIAALILPKFMDLSPVNPLLDKIIATVGPLALFSIGLQLKFSKWRTEIKNITFGLVYKLMIAPALVLLAAFIFKTKGIVPQISLFEAAMPTLVTGSLIADQYKLNSQLSNLLVGLGILLSFLTTAFWWYIMQILLS
ncbi:AEC family transporter [Pararcticibacter amylolyticus]|uniref:Transporter n=1 Tax=Pararcticibacter amylolyticus TaxID=2173175 RepID=A0A2U2PBJ5_9SPHI|nr:AEC family transporter [Pararcticibacter amylolyticus]PWG78767.1 transporter [Pararcticibacter amylolyticus]